MNYKYDEIFVALNDMVVTNDYDEQITISKNSLLTFITIYNEGNDEEKWIFYHFGDSSLSQIIIPGSIARVQLKTQFEHYQEQFAHLNQNDSYFGQIRENSFFIIKENDKKFLYEKIGEYTSCDGKKYNSIRLPTLEHDNWSVDKEETYKNKEFYYFNPDQKINSDIFFEKVFHLPQPLEVCQFFVDFPKMLNVVECFFRKQDLSDELRKEYDAYSTRKRQAEEYWEEYGSIPIDKVQIEIALKKKEEQRNQIMREIEVETENFRQDLIKKRLKF